MHLPVLDIFGNSTPKFSMPWFGRHSVLEHLLLLSLQVVFLSKIHSHGARHSYLSSMLQFKLVKIRPCVTQIRLNLDGTLEPLASLGDLPLCPKQPIMWQAVIRGAHTTLTAQDSLGHRKQHMGIMLTLLQCIHTLRLPLWASLQEDGFRPEDPRRRALLHGLGHVGHGNVLFPSSHFNPDSFQPQLRAVWDLVSSFLQHRARFCELACFLLQAREKQPQVHRLRDPFQLSGGRRGVVERD